MRLVVADFVPSAPFDSLNAQTINERSDRSNNKTNYEPRFVFFSLSIKLFLADQDYAKPWIKAV